MVTFARPLKVTPVRAKDFLDLADHQKSGRHPLRVGTERKTRRTDAHHAVQLQQFGDENPRFSAKTLGESASATKPVHPR